MQRNAANHRHEAVPSTTNPSYLNLAMNEANASRACTRVTTPWKLYRKLQTSKLMTNLQR